MFWSQDPPILLKNIETPREIAFVWVTFIGSY